MFVATQTEVHRDFFLPVDSAGDRARIPAGTALGSKASTKDNDHGAPPSDRATWLSVVMLTVALVATVGLAKVESPSIESAVDRVRCRSSPL
jgi:Ca2+:H+ antiporter